MKSLQKFCIYNPVSTTMFFMAIVLTGAISLSRLEINLLPEIEFPRITIVTIFPDTSPEEVENLVTQKISESVATINGVEKVESESMEGVSFVTLQFKWNK